MKILGLLALLALALPATATDKNGNYAIWGVGSSACIKYSSMRTSKEDGNYRDYLMGYMTAYNNLAENTYSISSTMTLDDILVWLDGECELKPTFSFDQVIMEFIIAHHEKRAKFPPGRFGN